MSLSLKQFINDYQNFDGYLRQFGEDPKLFPGEMNKFIKLAKIASEKKMLNYKEDAMVKFPNFDSLVRSANSYEDILERYSTELAALLSTCSNKASFYKNEYNKLKSVPVVRHTVIEAIVPEENTPVAESISEIEICQSRVDAQKKESSEAFADFIEGTHDDLGGFLSNDLLPKFVNLRTTLSSKKGVDELFKFASDSEKKIIDIMNHMRIFPVVVKFLRGEISEEEYEVLITAESEKIQSEEIDWNTLR